MSQDTIKKVLTTSSLAVATLVGVNAKVSAQEVSVDSSGKNELVSVSETTEVKPEVTSSEVISEVVSEPLELAKEAPKDDSTSLVAKGEVTRSDEDGEVTTGGSVLDKKTEDLGSRQTFNDGNDFHKVSITQSPYNSTVYIQNKIGSGENVSTGFGTGVFVSDNVFVTAAHNFYDPKTKELLKGEFYYYTGTDGVDHEGKRYRIDPSQIQRLTDASGFESVSKTDLVAVKTNEVLSLVNPGATPAKVSEKASSADNVNVVGYPGRLPSKNIKRGELHASVGDVNTSRYRSGMFVYQNDTLPGMSGAPIFNSDNELVGLHLGTVTWSDNKEMSNVGLTFRDNGFENYLNGHFAYFEDGKLYYGSSLNDLDAYHQLDDIRAFLFTNEEFEKIANKPLDSRPLEVKSYEMILIHEADDGRPKNGDNGNYDGHAFLVNDKYIAHFENGYHVDKYEDGHGFYDYYNKDGFFVEGGLLYESVFDKNYIVTNERFNYLTSLYEQPELSLDKSNDTKDLQNDRHNLLVSEMVEPENKKGVLDSHKYEDSDFDF